MKKLNPIFPFVLLLGVVLSIFPHKSSALTLEQREQAQTLALFQLEEMVREDHEIFETASQILKDPEFQKLTYEDLKALTKKPKKRRLSKALGYLVGTAFQVVLLPGILGGEIYKGVTCGLGEFNTYRNQNCLPYFYIKSSSEPGLSEAQLLAYITYSTALLMNIPVAFALPLIAAPAAFAFMTITPCWGSGKSPSLDNYCDTSLATYEKGYLFVPMKWVGRSAGSIIHYPAKWVIKLGKKLF